MKKKKLLLHLKLGFENRWMRNLQIGQWPLDMELDVEESRVDENFEIEIQNWKIPDNQ
jgi:hypothetical protein